MDLHESNWLFLEYFAVCLSYDSVLGLLLKTVLWYIVRGTPTLKELAVKFVIALTHHNEKVCSFLLVLCTCIFPSHLTILFARRRLPTFSRLLRRKR
jgi:hypothetical protein